MPADNQSNYPVLEFDGKKEPSIAENIHHAQMAGWPKILTYDGKKDAINRKKVMNSPEGKVPNIEGKRLHRDEVPFYCTKENTGSPWIGHAVASENRSQGGQLSAFLRKHGAYAGVKNAGNEFKFIVRVISLPRHLEHKQGRYTPQAGRDRNP